MFFGSEDILAVAHNFKGLSFTEGEDIGLDLGLGQLDLLE